MGSLGRVFNDLILHLQKIKSKFKKDDAVQLIHGEELMIVRSVKRRAKAFSVSCQWFDTKMKITRIQVFSEDELKSFDWNNPLK